MVLACNIIIVSGFRAAVQTGKLICLMGVSIVAYIYIEQLSVC